jgi:hypothetical protein
VHASWKWFQDACKVQRKQFWLVSIFWNNCQSMCTYLQRRKSPQRRGRSMSARLTFSAYYLFRRYRRAGMDEIGQCSKVSILRRQRATCRHLYGQTTIVAHVDNNRPLPKLQWQTFSSSDEQNVLRFLVETLIRWSVTNGKTNFNWLHFSSSCTIETWNLFTSKKCTNKKWIFAIE